ncbi:MAG: amino acid ABC transporter permease [Alphaproteobacteria bacterium]
MDLRFFEIYRNSEFLLLLAKGAMLSAGLTVLAAVFGMVLAFILAAIRFGRVPVLEWIAAAYVEFIRNTPLIVQLFFIAFGLPMLLGYEWPFWAHALLSLSINFSGYFAEILRAGLEGTGKGQREAARALGLKPPVTFFLVITPVAVASMFASLNSQFIFLFLTTGIISEIGVADLTQAGLYIDSRTFRTFEVFLVLTALYIVLSMMFKTALALIERWLFPWKFVR